MLVKSDRNITILVFATLRTILFPLSHSVTRGIDLIFLFTSFKGELSYKKFVSSTKWWILEKFMALGYSWISKTSDLLSVIDVNLSYGLGKSV